MARIINLIYAVADAVERQAHAFADAVVGPQPAPAWSQRVNAVASLAIGVSVVVLLPAAVLVRALMWVAF